MAGGILARAHRLYVAYIEKNVKIAVRIQQRVGERRDIGRRRRLSNSLDLRLNQVSGPGAKLFQDQVVFVNTGLTGNAPGVLLEDLGNIVTMSNQWTMPGTPGRRSSKFSKIVDQSGRFGRSQLSADVCAHHASRLMKRSWRSGLGGKISAQGTIPCIVPA